MKNIQITLGQAGDIPVAVAMDDRVDNRSITILGRSGSGKSTEICYLQRQLAESGMKMIEFDFSDSAVTKGFTQEQTRVIDVKRNNFVSPLSRRYNVYGIPESEAGYAKRISDLLANSLKLGNRQKNLIYSIIYRLAIDGKEANFDQLYYNLDDDDSSAAGIKIKIAYLMHEKVFQNGNQEGWYALLDDDKPLQILSFSGFPAEERKVIAELLLDDLKYYLTESGPGKNNFILILDECQNLRLTSNMPTAFFLSQGRKYGCGVWLATQSPNYFKREELAQLYQSALVLNFQANLDERNAICRKMAKNAKEQQKLLSMFERLGRGMFIASGRFLRLDGNLSGYGHLIVNNVIS